MDMQFYDNNFEVGEGGKGGFDGILQRRKKIGFIKIKIYMRYWYRNKASQEKFGGG